MAKPERSNMSEPTRLGTLLDVDPRAAWAHEAHAFTPWLADNLARLGDAIGVKLELTAVEHLVGRFSADIVARGIFDDSVVMIENQLERSDHTHLGQIMTYLAGTEAKTVIWVAPDFCEEHLSAIRWLNQHSHEEFSFFAVKLRVVQIANSPLAPLFDVLEKPNNWDRTLNKQVRSQDASEATLLRRAFWNDYAQADPAVRDDRSTGPGGSNRWREVPGTDFVINRYKSKTNVGLFIITTADVSDEEFFDFMSPYVEEMEEALDVAPSRWNTFWKVGPTISDDPTSWPAAIAWLVAETERYTSAVSRILPPEFE